MNKKNWTLCTIDDPNFLPGKSIYDMIEVCLKGEDFHYIILNQIYGISEAIANLEKQENKVLKIQDIKSNLCEVKQFDWGDFFLFSKYPENWVCPTEIIYYPDLIAKTDTAIRAIDDQYIYVYTPYENIVSEIKNKYQVESIKTDILENLDYPY